MESTVQIGRKPGSYSHKPVCSSFKGGRFGSPWSGFTVLFTSFQCSRALLQNLICNKRNQRNVPSKAKRVGCAHYGLFCKMFFKMICFVIHDKHKILSSLTS